MVTMTNTQLFLALVTLLVPIMSGFVISSRAFDARLIGLQDTINARFAAIEARLDRLEARIDRLEARFDRMEDEIRRDHEQRITRLEERLERAS
jgi:hypothetical protein